MWKGVGHLLSRDEMAKVPTTALDSDSIGTDQQARTPSSLATCCRSAHRGSVRVSDTYTGSPQQAAVPQDFVRGQRQC